MNVKPLNILVTGSDGYIGSVLSPLLLARHYNVIGVDTGFYRDGMLFNDNKVMQQFPKVLNKDIRLLSENDLSGINTIIHMGELSNDPLAENNPEITFEINYKASVRLAELAKKVGVSRFIYTSSCSVYGCGSSDILDESSSTNPQTPYAECKVLVEQSLQQLASSEFTPILLRNATAYGASPRMRFDIVLNNLAGLAWTRKTIAMTSDGTPWRPLVHVNDICNAILCCIEAPRDAIHNEIFNVGHNGDNYQIKKIASIVESVFEDCKLTLGDSSGDNRSYRVAFDKIQSRLPGFQCQWTAKDGAIQLRNIFKRICLSSSIFDFRPYTRLNNIKHLLETGQIDNNFYWRS